MTSHYSNICTLSIEINFLSQTLNGEICHLFSNNQGSLLIQKLMTFWSYFHILKYSICMCHSVSPGMVRSCFVYTGCWTWQGDSRNVMAADGSWKGHFSLLDSFPRSITVSYHQTPSIPKPQRLICWWAELPLSLLTQKYLLVFFQNQMPKFATLTCTFPCGTSHTNNFREIAAVHQKASWT